MRLDHALSWSARRKRTGFLFRSVGRLGSPWAVAGEGVLAALAMRGQPPRAVSIALAGPIAIGVGKLVKRIISRRRPGLARFRHNGHESFPSTHVAGQTALLACLVRHSPGTPAWRLALTAAGAVALVTAFERVRESRHWPTDVAAGAVLGTLVGCAVGLVAQKATLERQRSTLSPAPLPAAQITRAAPSQAL